MAGYPSNCGCDTESSSSGASGTAGCEGLNVPCLTVVNGLVTSLSDRTLTIPTQEVCPSDLCQESATEGQVITWDGEGWVPDDIPTPTARYALAWPLAAPNSGATGSINLASDGEPVNDANDYMVYVAPFNPTNFRISCWSVNCEAFAGVFGYSIEWSTDLITWTPVSEILDLQSTTSEQVSVSGTLAIGGSPTTVYFRFIYINETDFDRTISWLSLFLTVWN